MVLSLPGGCSVHVSWVEGSLGVVVLGEVNSELHMLGPDCRSDSVCAERQLPA